MNLCDKVCGHNEEAIPVYVTCQAFSPNSFHKNPYYSYAELLIHRLTVWHWRNITPSEEMSHCSRKQATCSWSPTSSAPSLLYGSRVTLPLGWLLLCSWVITINRASISCSENRSLSPFWHVFIGPCIKRVRFVSGHLSEDGHKFCSNLPQIFGSYIIMYYMMCLEY